MWFLILISVHVVHYVYRLGTVVPSLQLWNEANLTTMSDFLSDLCHSVCQGLVKDFFFHVCLLKKLVCSFHSFFPWSKVFIYSWINFGNSYMSSNVFISCTFPIYCSLTFQNSFLQCSGFSGVYYDFAFFMSNFTELFFPSFMKFVLRLIYSYQNV